jgi:hypothetical protein
MTSCLTGAFFHSIGGLILAPSPVNSLGIAPPSVTTELVNTKLDLGASAKRTEEKISNVKKFRKERFTLLKPH